MNLLKRLLGAKSAPDPSPSLVGYEVRKFIETDFSGTHQIVTVDTTDAPIILDPATVVYGFGETAALMEDAVIHAALNSHYTDFWAAVLRHNPKVMLFNLSGPKPFDDYQRYVIAFLKVMRDLMDLKVNSVAFDVFDYEVSNGIHKPLFAGFQFREPCCRIILARSNKVLPTAG